MVKTEGFYDPKSEIAAPVRGKPGPKPRIKEQGVDMRATAAGQPLAEAMASRLAPITVDDESDRALTADAAFVPEVSEREVLHADIARIRAQRKPFGAFTQKLAYDARSGYHRHWFNDEPGRVDEAVSNGWAHVQGKDDKSVKRVVGRARDGGPMYGYLLELPEIFWAEDMAAKHDAAQARIDEIKKNPFSAKPGQAQKSDAGKFYSPKDEPLTMTQTNVRSAPSH